MRHTQDGLQVSVNGQEDQPVGEMGEEVEVCW